MSKTTFCKEDLSSFELLWQPKETNKMQKSQVEIGIKAKRLCRENTLLFKQTERLKGTDTETDFYFIFFDSSSNEC